MGRWPRVPYDLDVGTPIERIYDRDGVIRTVERPIAPHFPPPGLAKDRVILADNLFLGVLGLESTVQSPHDAAPKET